MLTKYFGPMHEVHYYLLYKGVSLPSESLIYLLFLQRQWKDQNAVFRYLRKKKIGLTVNDPFICSDNHILSAVCFIF